VVQAGQMGRTRENTGCLAAATKWATRAQTNLPNKRTPRGGNTTGMNQETMDRFEEQRRKCEAHEAREVEIDATEARRLEQVRAAKADGKLYDWQAWDANKAVHATVPVAVGQILLLGIQP